MVKSANIFYVFEAISNDNLNPEMAKAGLFQQKTELENKKFRAKGEEIEEFTIFAPAFRQIRKAEPEKSAVHIIYNILFTT